MLNIVKLSEIVNIVSGPLISCKAFLAVYNVFPIFTLPTFSYNLFFIK
jgi:hypothetical protein